MKIELESLNKSFSENIETSNVARENMNDMIAQRKQIENELEMLDNHMFAKDEDLRKMQEQLRIAVEGVEDQSEDKDNEIRMLVATLHEKDAELAELHGRAEALSNTLHEKDTALDELHGRAEALSNTLNEKNTELADSSRSSQRVDELSILLQNLTEQKDTELQDKTSDLREKDTELQEKTFDLREKDAALREKDDDLRVKDAEIQDKDTALREKGVEVREKDAALREKDAELKDKNEEIMKCSLRIQEVSAALQEQSEKDEERYHEKESIIQQKRELNLRLNEAEKANTDIINMTFKEKNNLETKNKDFQQFVSDLKKENRRMSEDMARMSHDLEMSESVLKRSNDEMQTKLYSTNVHRENAESEVSTWSERASEH